MHSFDSSTTTIDAYNFLQYNKALKIAKMRRQLKTAGALHIHYDQNVLFTLCLLGCYEVVVFKDVTRYALKALSNC